MIAPRLALGAILAIAAGAPAVAIEPEIIGRSVQGRPMLLYRIGAADAPRTVLVVGCIHGNECAAFPVIGRLLRGPEVAGARVLVIPSVNPDGRYADTRGNAHGVDLNRNFSVGWVRIPRPSRYYSGPGPFSEPETRALRDLVRAERPDLSIWFHQPEGNVRDDDGWPEGRRYARLVGLPFRALASPPGVASEWIEAEVPGAHVFTVELPAGEMSVAAARRHHAAVRAVASRPGG